MTEFKILEGVKEQGIVVGNTYDKYNSKNPAVERIMMGFHKAMDELVAKAAPDSRVRAGIDPSAMYYQLKPYFKRSEGADLVFFKCIEG